MTPDFEHSLSLPATPVRIRVGAFFCSSPSLFGYVSVFEDCVDFLFLLFFSSSSSLFLLFSVGYLLEAGVGCPVMVMPLRVIYIYLGRG